MSLIVSPLSAVPELCVAHRPSHLLTLLSPGADPPELAAAVAERRLRVSVHDIIEPAEGMTPPAAGHVRELLDFAADWDPAQPFLIHCWAGVSRSTAAAFAIACQHRPDLPELAIARALRTASALATPNALIVALADRALGRNGRMTAAVEAIGRGEYVEGVNAPFRLPLETL